MLLADGEQEPEHALPLLEAIKAVVAAPETHAASLPGRAWTQPPVQVQTTRELEADRRADSRTNDSTTDVVLASDNFTATRRSGRVAVDRGFLVYANKNRALSLVTLHAKSRTTVCPETLRANSPEQGRPFCPEHFLALGQPVGSAFSFVSSRFSRATAVVASSIASSRLRWYPRA